MNKKDREHIGYLLSSSESWDDFKDCLFAYDAKIEEEFDGFEWARGRDTEVDDEAERMLIEKFGNSWALVRACTSDETKKIYEQARRKVYGDDYEYIFEKGG